MGDRQNKTWQFWIDRGGTFTDIVAVRNDGVTRVHKLLSENPSFYEDAALSGIKKILGVSPTSPIPPKTISQVKLGTTVATNALLERKGETTALITNTGFADIFRIGYQNRQDLFAQEIFVPENLYSSIVELPGRLNAKGEEIKKFNKNLARQKLSQVFETGIKSCAIVFIHSYLNPEHEELCQSIAEEVGFESVAISSKTSPLIKLIYRGDTTVADAYLSPVLNKYIEKFADPLGDSKLFFMQSNGGLVDRKFFSGKDSLLSGPAGGVVGAAKTCENIGQNKIIGFDMGGTSTDVSHYDGEYTFKDENIIAQTRIRTPVIDINTVAAGGGSIVTFDGERFRVGPQSAGAEPGPACYRKGGPLTVTDCNLQLGRIQPNYFPKVFGESGKEKLDKQTVEKAFAKLKNDIEKENKSFTMDEIAWGFLEIAVDKMAQAIKKITVERGIDVRDHALCSFGGAGGQHACLIAEKLGVKTVIVHPLAGVLSAVGIGLSNLKVVETKSINVVLSSALVTSIEAEFSQLAALSTNKLEDQLSDKTSLKENQEGTSDLVKMQKKLLIKYEGADTSLELIFSNKEHLENKFHELHEKRYGFKSEEKSLIVESIRIETELPTMTGENRIASSFSSNNDIGNFSATEENAPVQNNSKKPNKKIPDQDKPQELDEQSFVSMFSKRKWHNTPVMRRDSVRGKIVSGPLMIIDDTSTNIIEPGWTVSIAPDNSLVIEHNDYKVTTSKESDIPAKTDTETTATNLQQADQSKHSDQSKLLDNDCNDDNNSDMANPVVLELFNNKFMAIAEEMGVTLRNTSHSVNIKERLDFSCAVFDSQGRLIANAPHMPVHLGSMGASVKSVIDKFGNSIKDGNSYVLNNPYNGGTHLPDITVITPVFYNTDSPLFFTASRGHHADIGGITPGSMPPNSTHIDEEGILIDPTLMVENGTFLETTVIDLLCNSRYPARNPVQNIQDLKAQVAANICGKAALLKLVEDYSAKVVLNYMDFIRKNAEYSVRNAISKIKEGSYQLNLDNSATVKVTISVDRIKQEAIVDFTGTSGQLSDSNLNAPSAITRAAVLYVFRTLVQDDIPLNDGCLEPIKIIIPPGSMLNPSHPSAVVAGNVETSQSIVDTLYGALGILAASQGTMNNFTFGNEKHQYYETICGGSGAGSEHHGTDAIHTHMTNSRLTDPEVLEWRYPVRLKRFSIRRGSGGNGKFKGGDGVVREIEFLEPVKASILSQRRQVAPFGLQGGSAAKTGRNYVIRHSGKIVELTGTDSIDMKSGDSFVIETPGGGGFGHPSEQSE